MDLDGISRIQPDCPHLIWGLTTLSYLENESILLLDETALSSAATGLGELPRNFSEFCRFVSQDLEGWRSRIEGSAYHCLRSRWMNAPPIARMLRSHWFWTWYETTRIIVGATEAGPEFTWHFDEFGAIGMEYRGIVSSNGRIVARGPNYISATSMTLKEAFAKFNQTVRQHWSNEAPLRSDDGPLFTVDELYRHALARSTHGRPTPPPRPGTGPLLDRAIRELLAAGGAATLKQISSYCALISTEDSIRAFHLGPRSETAIQNSIDAAVAQMRHPTLSDNGAVGIEHESITPLVWHREEAGALAWSQYFQESLSLFDAWLSRNSYLNIAPQMFVEDKLSKHIWNRISRFLSGLFLSVEVTIYRYCVADPGIPLKVIGTFFEYGESHEAERRRRTMEEAATDPVGRHKSVSYRAADNNQSQYVPTTLAAGMDLVLDPPMAGGDEAESVLAIPIRLNGGVWGVLELVSIRSNHFGSLLRSKCEEVAAKLSTGFLIANIFETLGRLDQYLSDEFAIDRGRRAELCYALSNIFLSDALSLYVGAREPEEGSFGIEKFGTWVSPNAKSQDRRFSDLDPSQIRHFLDGDAQVEETMGGSEMQRGTSSRRTFIVRLVARGAASWSGALVFSVPYPIIADAGWRHTTFALGQIVAGVIANVTSEASWNKEARRDLRHEYKRISEGLRGVWERLSRLVRRAAPHLEGSEQRSLDLIPGDLDDLIHSLDAVSDALLADVYDRLLHDDRRLIAVKRAQEEYLYHKGELAHPRDLYHSRFINAVNADPRKHLNVKFRPGADEMLVRMHPGTLSDVLGTLADNAVKYSVPSTDIFMTFIDGPQRSLLMRISNLAPALGPDEIDEIFEDGFRGRAARELMPDRGSGRGLRFARGAMELWNGGLDYDWDHPSTPMKSADGRPIVWHRFTIAFPKDLLVEE